MFFSIVSAILLILAFPNFNLDYLIFIGFVPLFFALQNKSPKKAFLISYACGFLFYIGTLYWLYYVTVFGLVVLCLYLALYFGIFGFLLTLFQKTEDRRQKTEDRKICPLSSDLCPLLFIPAIWAACEYIQSHIFTGFGWALLGYSQYKNLPLIQIADFSSVYGVSFVIIFVNVAAWKLIRTVTELRRQKTEDRRQKNLSSVLCPLLSVTLILTLVYGYGYFRLGEQDGNRAIKVSVIQGNIPQGLKWDPRATDAILDKYSTLTRKAVFDDPDLIIWPETSFPGFFVSDAKLTERVLNLAKAIKTPLLLGTNTEEDLNEGSHEILQPFGLQDEPSEEERQRNFPTAHLESFNSAVLVSKKGEIIDRYNKIHLVPFGEFVPFSDKFPFLHNVVLGELGEFTAGKEFKIFTLYASRFTLHAKFGVLICFEDIFPELAKAFVQNGADFLVVITNDAWYGKSSAPYQHAACSVFRAIETRVPVVRCANTGFSCFIDSKGRIYDPVEERGSHLFITGYKTSTLEL